MERPFPAYKGDELYIFVSYLHKEASAVFPELTWLKDLGLNIWFDEGIEAGSEWREEIGRAIKHASLFLYFVSSESVQSENCRKEVSLADKEHIPIVAIHLENTDLPDGLDLTLSDRQAILKYEISNQEYQQKLQSRISICLDQPIIQPTLEKAKTNTSDKVNLVTMQSIGVLPFANMSSNEETGFFADGLSEDILDNLAQTSYAEVKNENIKVASGLASLQFTDRGQDPSSIGEKLKVAYLLEGSVRQRGDSLRITAQLIRTEDGFQVWSKSYERTLADGFEMQTAVAANIAYITRSKLISDVFKNYGWKQQEEFDGIDPIAVEHYISSADEYLNIRLGEGGDWETRVQFLKNAVEADPNFYLAYSWLANAYYQRHRFRLLSLQEARPAAHAAITSALALAPDNIHVQFQLATIHLHLDLDYPPAKAGIKQVLTHRPKWGLCHLRLARIALREGRTSEALRQLANASEFNSGTERALFFGFTAGIRCFAGDYEGALKASAQGLKLASGGQDRARNLKVHARSLIMLERVEEAKLFIEEGWNLDGSTNPESYIALFANIGEIEKSKKILTDARFNLVDHYELATGYLALGDIDNTFNLIQAGIEDHDPYLIESLLVAEWWNPIRDDPRFDEMLELLDSKVTHTEQYLRDHNIEQDDQ